MPRLPSFFCEWDKVSHTVLITLLFAWRCSYSLCMKMSAKCCELTSFVQHVVNPELTHLCTFSSSLHLQPLISQLWRHYWLCILGLADIASQMDVAVFCNNLYTLLLDHHSTFSAANNIEQLSCPLYKLNSDQHTNSKEMMFILFWWDTLSWCWW